MFHPLRQSETLTKNFYYRIRTLLILCKYSVNFPFTTPTMLINTGFYEKTCPYSFVRLVILIYFVITYLDLSWQFELKLIFTLVPWSRDDWIAIEWFKLSKIFLLKNKPNPDAFLSFLPL